MENLQCVKKELERIFEKGYKFNGGTSSSFGFAEVIIDCDNKSAMLAIHNSKEMDDTTLVGLIDFDYMLNIEKKKVGLKAKRFYEDEEVYAWLTFEEVNFNNNVVQIICELYISYR